MIKISKSTIIHRMHIIDKQKTGFFECTIKDIEKQEIFYLNTAIIEQNRQPVDITSIEFFINKFNKQIGSNILDFIPYLHNQEKLNFRN